MAYIPSQHKTSFVCTTAVYQDSTKRHLWAQGLYIKKAKNVICVRKDCTSRKRNTSFKCTWLIYQVSTKRHFCAQGLYMKSAQNVICVHKGFISSKHKTLFVCARVIYQVRKNVICVHKVNIQLIRERLSEKKHKTAENVLCERKAYISSEHKTSFVSARLIYQLSTKRHLWAQGLYIKWAQNDICGYRGIISGKHRTLIVGARVIYQVSTKRH